MLFQSFSTGARRKRWSTLFPAVPHETESWISQWFFRGGGEQNGLPTLVLLNIERPLIQTLSWQLWETDGIVPDRDGCQVQASQSRQECRAFQEASATHGGDFLLDANAQKEFTG